MDEKIVKDSQGLAKELVNDCISRQAAIKALGERPMVWTGSDYELGARNQYDADALAIETVPSAQPERKRGRWIYGEDNPGTGRDGWFCSECEHFEMWDYSADMKSAELNLPNFCPNCGAMMKGADDGTR